MFVQVIKGTTSDRAGLLAEGDRWEREVRPGVAGYLGGTFGVADDGTFFVIARFADAAAAQVNAARPEQGDWWAVASKLFDGEPTFRESTDTEVLFAGETPAAGFVQVMEGRAGDRAAVAAMQSSELMDQLRAARPDLLGVLRVWFDGDEYVEAAYFTSEADARSGEAKPDFAGPQEGFDEVMGVQSFTDLRDPRIGS